MDREEIRQYQEQFQTELDRCIRFWLEHGMDAEHGGIYTCLDRVGRIYSTDKSVWMQGRCAWTFARLSNQYGSRPEWLNASRSCLDFIDRYCIDTDGRMFFTVTKDGRPLRKRRYFFSEVFSVMAHAEYAKATGDRNALETAKRQFAFVAEIYRERSKDPYKIPPKTDPKTRSGRSLAEPMMLLNLTLVLRACDPENTAHYRSCSRDYISDILNYHWKPAQSMLLETVGTNGEYWNFCSAGRQINPGHDIEASWFLLSAATDENDPALADTAEAIFRSAVMRGRDERYGGLLYFVDAEHLPPEQYEHDMKLWWVHNEAIIASLMFYRHTRKEVYADLFREYTAYAFRVFSDPEVGEWYGYLRRDGTPTEPPCKGSTFKGPFHLPRMLMTVDAMLESEKQMPTDRLMK